MRNLSLICLLLSAASGLTRADVWLEPDPWRREALLEGRDFDYNSEAFLHRESYRHRSAQPASDRDGVRGTAGSVSGDELYTDIHLQKSLWADNGRIGFFARMQRFEDFDGDFDRQIVGVAGRFGTQWQVALAGDVKGSKAETDVQIEARWQPDEDRLLRLVYVAPELLFNDKEGEGRYRDQPHTAFVHYRHRTAAGALAELALNLSPRAGFETGDGGLLASGRQYRAMFHGELPFGGQRFGVRLEAEQTRRRFDWLEAPAPDADSFQRDMFAMSVYLGFDDVRFTPEVGVRHFSLEEDGWFGSNSASTGRVRRDEQIAWAGLVIPTTPRQRWEPTVYVDRFDVSRQFFQAPARNSDRDGWAAKLAVPWRYTVSEASDAVVTVNLTFRLHTVAFGGGNVQLHWPL
jgi:hypothetical protein